MMLKKNQYQVSEKDRSHKVSHINTISKIKKSKEDLQTSFVSNSFSPLHVSFSVLIVIPPNLQNNRTILLLITGYNSCSWDYHYINIFPYNFRPLEKIGRGGGWVFGRYPHFLTSKYTSLFYPRHLFFFALKVRVSPPSKSQLSQAHPHK